MSANLLHSNEDSLALGARIARVAQPGDIVTLSGPLGAGKTSIARGLLTELGLAGEAPSPSYAIVQPYAPPEVRFPVLHVDLYRIEDADEVAELGLWDALHESLLVVEWPERLPDETWAGALRLGLLIEADGVRRLTAMVPEAWRQRWSLI